MPVSADNIRFFAGAARVLEGKSAGEYMAGYTSMVRREPLGIVGGIAPWNYPLMMAVWKIGPALAAGNVQVLKPSEQTPLTTLRFAELAAEILPPGVLNVITGDGVPVGEGIVKHPDVRMVSLTGDVATGKEIARTAADTLKRVHLELGGKAPVLVFDDADPAAVAEGIKIAGYWNSGQDCTAASRVVAGPKIYDKLLDELVPTVESLHVGDPAEGDEIEMGPVISKAQQERVLGFLDRAKGAKVLTGGGTNGDRGFFVKPTVVTEVGQEDEIVQREVFGPVVTVQRFADDDQAIAWANDVELRPRRLGLDAGHRPCAERGAQAPVRDGLDQRPHPAGLGDAARRLQAVRLRQGPDGVLARGLHADQARDGEDRLGAGNRGPRQRVVSDTAGVCTPECLGRFGSAETVLCCAMRGRVVVKPRIAQTRATRAARGAVSAAPNLDRIDQRLIEALQQNGREPFRRIAAEVGVSEATIRARYQRLCEDNILQVTGVTNPLGLGFDAAGDGRDPDERFRRSRSPRRSRSGTRRTTS